MNRHQMPMKDPLDSTVEKKIKRRGRRWTLKNHAHLWQQFLYSKTELAATMW
jgi:hypothetical protein